MKVRRDGTVGDVTVYLDDLIINFRSEASRITPLKSAVKRVFSTAGGLGWRELKVIEVNLDRIIERFKLLSEEEDFSDHTFAAYRARINRAFKWYEEFLENKEWTPFLSKDTFKEISTNLFYCYGTDSEAEKVRTDAMITYPFPLMRGGEAQLKLPVRLSRQDAERIKLFVDSLAVEGEDATK